MGENGETLMQVSNDTKEKINQLQLMEQSLQNFLLQRQTHQAQLNEVNSALEELEKAEVSYKIIGNVMVKMDKKALMEQLQEKKETVNLRITSIEKQEEKVRAKIEEMQADVMKEMKKNG